MFIAFLNQVMRSAEKTPRTVDVVLFFGSQEYGDYLEMSTAFQLVKEIPLPDFHKDPRERFLIYRLPKMD
ncbi:hypothetical protein B481_2471 [Planococcus halocryophilus Or1]|nr:hypothetical protein B481_2471 [Planococcus halocryophilus Or1]